VPVAPAEPNSKHRTAQNAAGCQRHRNLPTNQEKTSRIDPKVGLSSERLSCALVRTRSHVYWHPSRRPDGMGLNSLCAVLILLYIPACHGIGTERAGGWATSKSGVVNHHLLCCCECEPRAHTRLPNCVHDTQPVRTRIWRTGASSVLVCLLGWSCICTPVCLYVCSSVSKAVWFGLCQVQTMARHHVTPMRSLLLPGCYSVVSCLVIFSCRLK
jgi:hypothetical protein